MNETEELAKGADQRAKKVHRQLVERASAQTMWKISEDRVCHSCTYYKEAKRNSRGGGIDHRSTALYADYKVPVWTRRERGFFLPLQFLPPRSSAASFANRVASNIMAIC